MYSNSVYYIDGNKVVFEGNVDGQSPDPYFGEFTSTLYEHIEKMFGKRIRVTVEEI